jgi:opacity protein-like surface antigen
MKQIVLGMLGAVALAAIAAAAPSLTGNWTMTVEGSPHGTATMGLTLKQDGSKVTGTFVSGHAADMEVAGEFVDGQLRIASTHGTDDEQVIFTAKLRDDGTLAGTVSSPMGDMTWTATRAAATTTK